MTLWHHLRWQLTGSVIVSMSTPMMMSSTSFLMLTMLSSVTDNIMKESKFNLYGEFIRPNGHQNYDILSYIAETREEAIATCKRLNPHFNIITIQVDDTAPEVVRLQPLR